MTKNQYVNIVKTTVTQNPDKNKHSLALGKATLKNLGVPFPSGTLEEAITALNTGKYMGWTPCSAQAAEACINNGYTAVAMNSQDMMVLLPGDTSSENTVAAAAEQNMSFYAYATVSEDTVNASATTISPATPTVYLNQPDANRIETLVDNHIIPISVEGANITKVSAFVNDDLFHSEFGDSFSVEYPVDSDGWYRIFAQGISAAGVTVTSPNRTVSVIQPPVVSVETTAKSIETLTANHTLPITATGSLCSTLELYVNDTLVGTSTMGNVSANYPVTAAGTYTIYAKGTNSLGYSVTTESITIKIVNLPTITISLASNDFPQPIYHGLTIPVNYASTNCNQVQFYINSQSTDPIDTTDGLFNYTCNSAGTYNIYAVASNEAGERFTSNTVTVTVTDDYVFQNDHFVFHTSLQNYIAQNPGIITPKALNTYMYKLNLGYKAMLDLVGTEPFPNTKITIQKGENHGYWQYITPDVSNIYWDESSITGIFSELNNNLDDWWLSGSMHELGHIFDTNFDDKWRFTSEGWATYKAWLAIERLGGKVDSVSPIESRFDKKSSYWTDHITNAFNQDGPFNYRKFIGEYASEFLYGDDIIYYIHPIFNKLGFDKGWNILKAVFRSYNDSNFSEPDFHGNVYQRNVQRFIYRCSYFATSLENETINIKKYWAPETLYNYNQNVTNPLNANNWIYVKYEDAKAGNNITVTVYDTISPIYEATMEIISQPNNIISQPNSTQLPTVVSIPIGESTVNLDYNFTTVGTKYRVKMTCGDKELLSNVFEITA